LFALSDGLVEFRKGKGDKTFVSVNAAEVVA
jgi:ribosomal protein L27